MKASSHRLFRTALRIALIFLVLITILVIWRFPRTTDQVASRTVTDADYKLFYEHSYASPGSQAASSDMGITRSYEVRDEEFSAAAKGSEEAPIHMFVKKYALQDKRVLDVGSGEGLYQDIVDDFTGLDISTTAARFYHKPYVVGSATEIPFPDNSFDVIWTVDVLEHVPKPERALSEMRRVLRPDGYLYIRAAWDCRPWAAEGYAVRPFGDLNLRGKLIKASIPIRDSLPFRALYTMPIRFLRLAGTSLSGKPTAFRYNELKPNYKHLWVSDADAVNSMDALEVIIWHTSRGDICLNHRSLVSQFLISSNPIIFQVKKKAPGTD